MKRLTEFLLLTTCLLLLIVSPSQAEEKTAVNSEANKPTYYRMYPDFIVNLNDKETDFYARLRVEILSRGAAASQQIEYHEALLRDSLITILNAKNKKEIRTAEGRKALGDETLEMIQAHLVKETGDTVAEKVLFTKFAID